MEPDKPQSRTQLQSLLETGLRDYADKTALYFESGAFSYRQLAQQTQMLAAGLQQQGICSGDRIALFLPNCPEAVMAFFACYLIGAIAVPLNYLYTASEARYVIEQTDASLILFHGIQKSIVDSFHDRFNADAMFCLQEPGIADGYRNLAKLFVSTDSFEISAVHEEHPAFILFTSGSTVIPRASCIPTGAPGMRFVFLAGRWISILTMYCWSVSQSAMPEDFKRS